MNTEDLQEGKEGQEQIKLNFWPRTTSRIPVAQDPGRDKQETERAPHEDAATENTERAPHEDAATETPERAPHEDATTENTERAPYEDAATETTERAPYKDATTETNLNKTNKNQEKTTNTATAPEQDEIAEQKEDPEQDKTKNKMPKSGNVSGSMLEGILPAPYIPKLHDFEEWAATLKCGLHAARLGNDSLVAIIRARVPEEGQDAICEMELEEDDPNALTKIIDELRTTLEPMRSQP